MILFDLGLIVRYFTRFDFIVRIILDFIRSLLFKQDLLKSEILLILAC